MPTKSILVVEDDRDVRESLTEALELEGYTVYAAQHGREALDFLTRDAKDVGVILLDLMMPVMDGRSFLEALERNHPQIYQTIPVVVVTAAGDSHRAGIKAAASLKKPIDLNELLDLVQSYCPPVSSTA